MIPKYFALIFSLMAAILGFAAGFAVHKALSNRRLRRMAAELEPIMRGDYSLRPSACREGAFGLLASQLELAVSRAKNAALRFEAEQNSVREFVADMSHQIKTPLAGIMSYLDLWSEEETDPEKTLQIESAVGLCERITELIRSLLELSRLESRSVSLQIEPLDARELAFRVQNAALASRPEETREISVSIPRGAVFRGDEKWLTQALVNLVVNALDYASGDGRVDISVVETERFFIFRVSNPGRLSRETLENMFRRFYRANPESQGFGLGLSIALWIARLHKGDLRAENTETGVSLVLSLPKNDCAESL